jgi:hypothetical protein
MNNNFGLLFFVGEVIELKKKICFFFFIVSAFDYKTLQITGQFFDNLSLLLASLPK